MGKENFNIEDIFRDSFKDHTNVPGDHVLRKIKFRLWVNDFFSFRYNKINIIYTSLVLAGTIFIFSHQTGQQNNTDKKQASITIAAQEQQKGLSVSKEIPVTEKIEDTAPNNKTTSSASNAIADFSASGLNGCAPLWIVFTNHSKNATSIEWDFGNGIKSDHQNPKYLFQEPGKYRVKLRAKNEFGTNEKITEVTVYGSPQAICDINMAKSSLKNKSVAFLNNSKNASSFFWDFGDGTSTTEKNPTHIYADFKVYNVTLIAKNNLGCTDTTTFLNAFIKKDYLLSFPTTFRPNPISPTNSGYYHSAENEKFIFYPRNNGVTEYTLEIFAGNGVRMFSTKDIKEGWNGYIKGKISPPGTYFYKSSGKYPNGQSFNYQGSFTVIVDNYNYY
jgi:PKD repeat protein